MSIHTIIIIILSISPAYTSLAMTVLHNSVAVAQCRASCGRQDPGESVGCWAGCGGSASLCGSAGCGRGCKAGCDWHENRNKVTLDRRMRSKLTMVFSSHLAITGCSLSWGSLEVSSNSFRSSYTMVEEWQRSPVYLVVGRDKSGQWYEVAQTYNTSAIISGKMSAKLDMVRVLAVGEVGILARNTIKMNGTNCEEKNIQATTQQVLKPVLVSSSTEGSIVRAKITWPAVDTKQGYLVRWQAFPGNLVLATLHTNNNTAMLPLRRNTHYMVEVQDLSTDFVSIPIIIDTTEEGSASIPTNLVVAAVLIILTIAAVAGAVFRCRKNDVKDMVKDNEDEKGVLNNNNMSRMNNMVEEVYYSTIPVSVVLTHDNLGTKKYSNLVSNILQV